MTSFTGTAGADRFRGGSGHDDAFGLGGDDTLAGMGGDDQLVGGDGDDKLIGGDGLDNLAGGDGDDVIVGGSGQLTLRGNLVTDTATGELLDGGAGADIIYSGGGDTIAGGDGLDTLRLNLKAAAEAVTGDLSAETGLLSDGTTVTGIEGGTVLLSAFSDSIAVGAGAWSVEARTGDDTVTGGAFADSFSGGHGDDVLLGGDGADLLVGSKFSGAGVPRYRTQHDLLDGGGGDDVLIGSATATLIGGGGVDAISLNLSQTDFAYSIDARQLGSTAGVDFGDGTVAAEVEQGSILLGFGDDVVVGVGEQEMLFFGGGGFDTVGLDCSAETQDLTVDLTNMRIGPVQVADSRLAFFEALSSFLMGSGNDRVVASASLLRESRSGEAVTLSGAAGDDTISVLGGAGYKALIDGGAGNDTLTVSGKIIDGTINGGAGDDQLKVTADIFVDCVVKTGEGNDRIEFVDAESAHGRPTGSENPLLAVITVSGGGGSDHLIGNSQSFEFRGGDGADTLEGGSGDDVLAGGQGNDLLKGGDGIDTVDYRLAKTGVRINLGEDGAGKPKGGQTTGGGGKDTCNGIENMMLTDLDDKAWGSSAANVIHGRDGGDMLQGGAGDDTLIGGRDADKLKGGEGADRFVYTAIGDSRSGAADLIQDFATDDVVDLTQIDANTALDGDQAFVRVADFSGTAGEMTVRFDTGSRTTIVSLDVNGDAEADAVIMLSRDATGAGFHFAL
jgi:Ca2+-binding RTX toxin-like protein